MEFTAFAEFGIVIALAAVLGIVASRLRQPAILGYIVTGLVIGAFHDKFNHSEEFLELFSKIGITFLLFILGLELNINELKRLGKVALATGLGQIIFTSLVGFFICLLFGFSTQTSFYISVALTFSSTIIIIKLLSQKNKLDTFYGRISVGFLLVQDFVAILILIALSAFKDIGGSDISKVIEGLLGALFKGIVAIFLIWLFTKFILNPLLNLIRHDKEVLFLTVIAWALALASLMGSDLIGFSIEIGGLVAGISLSNRLEHLQIGSWTKPLRDFFITLFFVILGLEINLDSVSTVITPAILLSLFVLIGNPLIVMVIMGYLGYSSKISFFTSLAVAQISEFSLIVAKFGFDLGHLDASVLTLLTLIGGITMTISTYMIFYNEELYDMLKKYLTVFEFKQQKAQDEQDMQPSYQSVVLFGCHRMGKSILNQIPNQKDKVLVVDLDPKTVKELKENGYNAIYGDITDVELYQAYAINKSKLVISTVPSLKDNIKLLSYIRSLDIKPMVVIVAYNDDAVKELYNLGADFVMYPHVLGGHLLSEIVSKEALTKRLVKIRSHHLEALNIFN
jgi:Kef-type K+ transport system membrane component KefB